MHGGGGGGVDVGACELPTIRMVLVEQFCSWSACRRKIVSMVRAISGSTTYSSHGVANIMCRKLAAYPRSLRGYMNGCPIECLYE